LRTTQGHVDSDRLVHGHPGFTQPLMGARILDLCIGDPGKHLFTLREHLLGGGIEIGNHFDRHCEQDRLTQPHPRKAFELAQGAIKGAFVLFSKTLLGLVGFVLQNQPFLPHELAW